MTDKETILIGCPICGDIYRWRPGANASQEEINKRWECLGKLPKEETVARTLQFGRAGMYGWLCMDCQKKRSAGR